MSSLKRNQFSPIEALRDHRHSPWYQIAALLLEIADSEAWQGYANSMQAFLRVVAPEIGIGYELLRRYLRAGRYYRDDIQTLLELGEYEHPELEDLPRYVSSQSIDILARIARAVSPGDVQLLARDILEKRITRDKLAKIWAEARAEAALERAPTDRKRIYNNGRRTELTEDTWAAEGAFALAIEHCGTSWLGNGVRRAIVVPGTSLKELDDNTRTNGFPFDYLVAAILPASPYILLHGINALAGNYSAAVDNLLIQGSPYVDRFWIASPAKGGPFSLNFLPKWAGHLSFDQTSLVALRLPVHSKQLGARSNDVVRYLLRDQFEKLVPNSGEPPP
jgi:hypothetical protein